MSAANVNVTFHGPAADVDAKALAAMLQAYTTPARPTRSDKVKAFAVDWVAYLIMFCLFRFALGAPLWAAVGVALILGELRD